MVERVPIAMLVTMVVTMKVTTIAPVFANLCHFDQQMILKQTNVWVRVNSLETALQFSLKLFPPDPVMTARDVSTRWRWWR